MTQANRSLLRNGTGDAERLQAQADGLGSVGRNFAAFFQRDGGAQGICPAGVLKCDGLYAFAQSLLH